MDGIIGKFNSKKEIEYYPKNQKVDNWVFEEKDKEEALLANSLGILAEKTGMSINELNHIFPAILRMMKSESNWSK